MGDFSPKPGGRAGSPPLRIFAAGNTTGATTSGTARSLSLRAAGIASVGLSNGSILVSASSAAQTAPTVSLYAVGNTTSSVSSGVNQAGSISFDGAGIVSVGVSGSSIVISASSAAQTVQTIGGLATGNTTGSSSSTTFDARSVTVSGAGGVSVGYSSNNILIVSGPVASGTVENKFALGNTTGQTSSTTYTLSNNSVSGAGIVSLGFSTTAAGAGVLIVSATTAAQTVQTIGGLATGNTTGSSSSTTFDARSVTVSGAGIVSVGYSSNNILIVSATTAAQTVQTIGGLATGNTTGSSSSTTFDARSLTVSGAGDISVGYSSNNILIISGTAPVASGTVVNMSAIGNTTAVSSSSSQTLTAISFSGAGGVSIGMSTTAAGSPVLVISGATTAAQTVQTIGGLAVGNTTGSSSSTTFDARSVTVSGAGGVSVGYSSNNILIVSGATTAAQTVQTIGGIATGNTTGSSSSTTFDARSLTVSGAGDISVGYSSNNILIISGTAPVASGTVVNMSVIGNTTAVASSSSQTLTAVSFSGAGGVSLGMSTTAAGSPVLVISGVTSSGTVQNLLALGNTTGQSSSTTVTLTNVSLSGAGIVSVGFSTTGAGAGVAIISASSAAQTVQTIGGLAAGNTTGSSSSTTFDARSVTVSGGGIVSVGYSSNNILIVSATSAASQGGLSFNAVGNTTGVTSSSASSLPETLTLSGAGGVSVGFSSSTIVISGVTSSGTVNNLFALGNTTGQSSSTSATLTNLSFSGAGVASVGYSTTAAGAGVVILSVPTGVGTSTGTASAVGNTTGLAASMANTFSTQVYSGAGGISVGFSSSTLIISANVNTSSFFAIGANTANAGSTTSMTALNTLSVSGKNDIDVAFSAGTLVVANQLISFYEPLPFAAQGTVTATLAPAIGTMAVGPFVVPSAISFNQLRFLVSRLSAAASLTMSSAAGASTTATASAGWNSTISAVIYSRQGGTSSQSFTTFTSTTATYGMTYSWSISRTAGSNTASATLSMGWAGGTSAALSSTFTITSSNAGTSVYAIAFTAASIFTNTTNQLLRMDIPFAATLGNGAYLLGVMGSSATATATGNSLNTAAAGNWNQSTVAVAQGFGAATAVIIPGNIINATQNFFPGVGSTSSAGSAVAGTIGWLGLSTQVSNAQLYVQAGQF